MCSSNQTALIVIDMLNDFFDPKIWPQSILPNCRLELATNINYLVGACRNLGVPIIWVKQEFREDLSDAFAHMRKGNKRYTIAGTEGCHFLSELKIDSSDVVLVKYRFSAFFNTKLHELLQERGSRHVILAGVTTGWCIRSTATDAYQHDYQVTLANDCMEGFTRSDHDESLRAMDGYIANSVAARDIVPMLSVPKNVPG